MPAVSAVRMAWRSTVATSPLGSDVGRTPALGGVASPGSGPRCARRRTCPARGPWPRTPSSAGRSPRRTPARSAKPIGRRSTWPSTCADSRAAGPTAMGASQSIGSRSRSVGPKRERGRRPGAGAHGLVVGHGDGHEQRRSRATVRPAATATPTISRRGRSDGPPSDRRATPKPLNRLVPSERQEPRIGGLERRQQGLRAERLELVDEPADRRAARSSSVPSPRATMSGNAPAPRASGGQATASAAMPMGRSIVTPTRTSSGPPGR